MVVLQGQAMRGRSDASMAAAAGVGQIGSEDVWRGGAGSSGMSGAWGNGMAYNGVNFDQPQQQMQVGLRRGSALPSASGS